MILLGVWIVHPTAINFPVNVTVNKKQILTVQFILEVVGGSGRYKTYVTTLQFQ